MQSTLESTLPWWIAGPLLGLVIVALLGLATRRFGVIGGVTDLVTGSSEGRGLRSWRVLLVLGMVLGALLYALLTGAPDAGLGYSWLDGHLGLGAEAAVLFAAGLAIGVGARTAGGCTSGHGLTGAALLSPASLVAAAVGVAFAGARLLRGHRAPLTGETIAWTPTRPTRSHVVGSVIFGIGWGISDACPGPTAAQLGAGRVLAIAVAAGTIASVALQPRLTAAAAPRRERRTREPHVPVIQGADVL